MSSSVLMPKGLRPANPWFALGALCIGFFMLLMDMTIVSVAQKAIMADLHADLSAGVWVSSVYLLTSAVPLLVAGRLGDKFGPSRIYLLGLFIFIASSGWCGFSHSIGMLIVARAVQGFGAALMTPQTMAMVTRIFPAHKRSAALGVWGATAGVATLVGPLAGGVIVDKLGWEWIFFVNLPVGVIALGLAFWLLPTFPTHDEPLDLVGVAVSGVGLFCLVIGLQEGESWNWDQRAWLLISAGVVLVVAFVSWQAKTRQSPLMPLGLFRDRNFAVSGVAIFAVGFAVTGTMIPIMLYLQVACGLSAMRAALVTTPMALATGFLAPVVGRLADRFHPSAVVGLGLGLIGSGVCLFAAQATPQAQHWRLMLAAAMIGAGVAGTFTPISAAANRNLPKNFAGAGAGVYNTIRMVGSVIGVAATGALMQVRVIDELPKMKSGASMEFMGELPAFLRGPFAAAMAQSMLLSVAVLAVAFVVVLFYKRPSPAGEDDLAVVPAGH